MCGATDTHKYWDWRDEIAITYMAVSLNRFICHILYVTGLHRFSYRNLPTTQEQLENCAIGINYINKAVVGLHK